MNEAAKTEKVKFGAHLKLNRGYCGGVGRRSFVAQVLPLNWQRLIENILNEGNE